MSILSNMNISVTIWPITNLNLDHYLGREKAALGFGTDQTLVSREHIHVAPHRAMIGKLASLRFLSYF